MTPSLFEKLDEEIRLALVGSVVRSVHSLGAHELAVAFDAEEFRILYLNFEPHDGRIYIIKRRLRDLKKQSIHPIPFAITLQKRLAGAMLRSVETVSNDRIVKLVFSANETSGDGNTFSLIAQLTRRYANLFLLDGERRILASARKPRDDSQAIGSVYVPPKRTNETESVHDSLLFDKLDLSGGRSLSEALDEYFQARESDVEFQILAKAAKNANAKEIAKRRKLIANLESDRRDHGEAQLWKKYGDLLLANANSAVRKGKTIHVADLYDEATPMIEIGADENDSIAEAAQKYFRKYAKARNAQTAIAERLSKALDEIKALEEKDVAIKNAIAARDIELLQSFSSPPRSVSAKQKTEKANSVFSGIRIFRSSDGFEILVGKKAKDNDQLTFKIAKSRDTWMHAADYPGSHVVVRNPDRKEIPQRTLIEAAELAAFYSQGKKQPKAAVHYTLKKFVNKPKRAAAGMVSLASFKTLLVEPGINIELQNVIR